MTSLLDLPRELVYSILSYFSVPNPGPYRFRFEDVEPAFNVGQLREGLAVLAKLCRTSSVLRELTEPLLYDFVFIPGATAAPLASLLRCWASRPHCARYTKRLTIETRWVPGWTPPQPICQEDVEMVSKMAKQMGLYVREGWEEYNWNTDIFIELAMLRAQNVRHVELEFHQLKGICRPSFEGLLAEHGDTTHIRLEKLEHLYLVKSGWRISDLDHVLDRAPSLNKLRLFVCDFKYPSTSLPTNLSDLCILRCPITPSRLISIIQQMERLSRLEFTIWRGQPEDLAKIVAALSKHSATLKSLTVCFGWNPRSGASRVKAPLETLTNLQSLTTDVRSFGLGPTGLVQSLPPALQRLRLIRSPETTEEDIQTFAYELQEAKRWGHEDLTVTSSGPKYWEDVDGKHDTAFQCKSVFLRA